MINIPINISYKYYDHYYSSSIIEERDEEFIKLEEYEKKLLLNKTSDISFKHNTYHVVVFNKFLHSCLFNTR